MGKNFPLAYFPMPQTAGPGRGCDRASGSPPGFPEPQVLSHHLMPAGDSPARSWDQTLSRVLNTGCDIPSGVFITTPNAYPSSSALMNPLRASQSCGHE